MSVTDLHSKHCEHVPRPSLSNFLYFDAVFRKFCLNHRLAPLLMGLVPGRLRNPGSATVIDRWKSMIHGHLDKISKSMHGLNLVENWK